MEAFKPKWLNSYIQYGVNPLKLEDLHMIQTQYKLNYIGNRGKFIIFKKTSKKDLNNSKAKPDALASIDFQE